MINHIELAEPRVIDDCMIENFVVVEGVDVDPVSGDAGSKVGIESTG